MTLDNNFVAQFRQNALDIPYGKAIIMWRERWKEGAIVIVIVVIDETKVTTIVVK